MPACVHADNGPDLAGRARRTAAWRRPEGTDRGTDASTRAPAAVELHATGRNDAELAPAHVRRILTAPTTEFEAPSLTGVAAALAFAVALRAHGPRWLGWLTLLFSAMCALVYLAGYGVP